MRSILTKTSWGVLCGAFLTSLYCSSCATPPAPTNGDAMSGEDLVDPARGDELEPGQSLEIKDPDRLALIHVRVWPPEAEALLDVKHVARSAGGSRIEIDAELTRLEDGALLILTKPEPSESIELTLDESAAAPVRVSVWRVKAASGHAYWSYLRERTTEYIREALEELPEMIALKDPARFTQTLSLHDDLERIISADDEATREVVEALGELWIDRDITLTRTFRGRYNLSAPLAQWLAEPPEKTKISGREDAPLWIIEPGKPIQFELEGPATLALRVRGEFPEDAPDIRLDYSVMFKDANAELISREHFSSQAALAQTQERDTDVFMSRPEPTYERDTRGAVISWPRSTKLWIPPGKNRFSLSTDDVPLRIEGKLITERAMLEDAATLTTLERATRALGALEPSSSTALLDAELAWYTGDRHRARALLTQISGADATPAHMCWRRWRELTWADTLAPLPDLLDCVGESTESEFEVALILAAAKHSMESGDLDIASSLLDKTRQDDPRVEQARADLLWLTAREDSRRWPAIALAYREWREDPLDARKRARAQSAWWAKSRWQRLRPVRARRRFEYLEALGPEHRELSLTKLAERRGVLYRILPDAPHKVTLPVAPDDPTRPARLRMLVAGKSRLDFHAMEIDGQPFSHIRTEPFERISYAVTPGEEHAISVSNGFHGQLYTQYPPTDREVVRASDVVERRQYWAIERGKRLRWEFEPAPVERFARIWLRGEPDSSRALLRLDCGSGDVRALRFLPTPGDRFEAAPPMLVVEIPANAREITLGLDQGDPNARLFASLEMRVARRADDIIEPIEPGVIEVTDEALAELTRQSQAMQSARAPGEDPELWLAHARLLMQLDRERLARIELEELLTTPKLAERHRRSALGMLQAIKIRMSSKWLTHPKLEPSQVMPLGLAGHIWRAPPSEPGECLFAMRGDDKARAREHSKACERAVQFTRLEALEPDSAPATELAAQLDELALLWAPELPSWRLDALRAQVLLDQIERDPSSAAIGQAAMAYGLARAALIEWPTSLTRGAYFRAAKWTQWRSVKPGGVSTRKGALPVSIKPLNHAMITPPSLDDPERVPVELALMGLGWRPEHAKSLLVNTRQRERFVAPATGLLAIELRCEDLRPDLQPSGAKPPCDAAPVVEGPDGPIALTDSQGDDRPAATRRQFYKVTRGERYTVTFTRADKLPGRRFFARLSVNNEPLFEHRYARKTSRVLTRTAPITFDLQGPAVFRVDARSKSSKAAPGSIKIEVASGDSKGITEEFELGAPLIRSLPFEDPSQLAQTSSSRALIWLPSDRTYTITLTREGRKDALINLYARVDDYINQLTPDGRGWRDADDLLGAETNAPLPTLDAEAATLPDYLSELDLGEDKTRSEWLVEGVVGVRARELADEIGLQETDSDRSYAYSTARWHHHFKRPAVWVTPEVGARYTRAQAVLGSVGATASWAPLSGPLRFDARLFGYAQQDIGPRRSARASLRAQYTHDHDQIWSSRTRLTLAGRREERVQELFAADPIIGSSYGNAHPLTLELESSLRRRLMQDAQMDFALKLRSNTGASIDQLGAKVTGRGLLSEFLLSPSYELRVLLRDEHRDELSVLQQIDLSAAFWTWAWSDHWFTVDGFMRVGYLLPDETPWRVRGGLRLTYWFSVNELGALPPSRSLFKDLRAPMYFVGGGPR